MEWATLQHLDVRHVGRGGTAKQLQPHAAAFHPTQALLSVAIGAHIIEFDALTGSKLSDVDIGAPVVRMAYSPTKAHAVIAILEDCTIRSCDFDMEQTCVLHSPERKTDSITSDTEVFLALTPLQPVVFFGFYRRMSVTVVGTVEGGRAPTKIKTDLKKPVVNLACHPRLPVLYVAYADGLIRAYNINSYAVNYTLQLDASTKLTGAGAFAFHPNLEWIFVGDRSGTLLAWDVSTERPNMIGIIQVGSQSIVSVAWLSMLRLLLTLSKDGALLVWKTRVVVNPNRPPMQATFFEPAGIEPINIPRILSQQGGEAVYPLPRIMGLEIHPKMNLAGLLFAGTSGSDIPKNKSRYTRDGRKQLFSVLQSARGSSASVLKEKLATLGSTGVLADHQLKALMQEYYVKGLSNHNVADIARKAILYSHFMEGQAKSKPISRLPLITIQDTKHHLKDIPVCWPIHLDLNFYNKENRVLHYPNRAFYIDGVNLMAYSISSSAEIVYKKLYASIPGNVEFRPMHIVYSKKQQLFLVMYEFSGSNNEIVVCWENNNSHPPINKGNNFKGRDAAFIGLTENQFVVLDEDKIGLSLYMLPGGSSMTTEKNMLSEQNMTAETVNNSVRGPIQYIFETEVHRLFSTPLDATLMYASNGDQISFARLIHSQISNSDGHYIPTKSKGRKTIKLEMDEIALEVAWQETLRGYVAGIITTHRVILVSADLDILASSSAKFDKGIPTFRSLLWVGPALLFSTSTSVSILGWDGVVRTILSISTPHSVLLGALNDRLLLANPTEINPRQKKGVEIKSCLVGLLEPLLIGFATMQQNFEQKIDLSEILYQITSRFDSLRITPRSLEILARGAPVCGDLAVALSQAGPQFTQQLRGGYAIRALRFSTALSVLRDDFLRSRDYPKCPSTSLLFHRFRQLGYACIKYGQFDSAKETFEAISDYESLVDLFICHLNPSAMRRLAQKLEDENSDPELKRYCERILRVRSSGWTQGIFANFAAESMVPKGPEWGGGNWDIKTPTNLKSIPNWELATEVLPYMKTDEGTIPTIVPDQIGVYLGSAKGRLNVVQVKDDSLVKAFIPSADNKPTPALPLTNPPKEKTNLEFLMDMDGSSKTNAGSSIIDEQARAEEEFKKTMYGSATDGNSSDEEGASKTKKIHIVINKKPASSAVDVDKIKEATRNMKLDEALGPHLRSKSLTGSQDFNELAIQAPTPASFDLFGTSSLARPAQPPIVSPSSNVGVSSGPIPEDFFQNTISSVQVAAALPPAGTYLSKLDEASRPPQINAVKPAFGPAAASPQAAHFEPVGLPDGGVPPQYTQSSGSHFEPVGLPDGGLPPQYSQPSASPAQQQPQVTAPTQPLDLSILGGTSPTDAGKPSEQEPLTPASVRPGQIPRGAPAAFCFKIGLLHLEQNQLFDALSCFDEAFLALAKDQSRGVDVKAQATIISQYKIAVTLLQEIARLQKVQGPSAISAKDEMARLSRHLSSLPLLAKHRINCIRTAIKRNMEVLNYAYSKQMLELLLSKAPPSKQEELRTLADMCVQRGGADKSIDPLEDPSHFCAATLSRVSTIGYDVCDLCGVKFSAMTTPGCIICGMGTLRRSDAAAAGAISSPFA